MGDVRDVLEGRARWCVVEGDSLDVLRAMPDASVDAVVTDPPAGIAFMGKAWDHDKGGRTAWIDWLAAILHEAHRVTKPGGRMFCWAIPRTCGWTQCAIEDAGWLVENAVGHLFGSGFPKGHSQLKPAMELWFLARKRGGKVLGLQIDACRVGTADDLNGGAYSEGGRSGNSTWSAVASGMFVEGGGRLPGQYQQPAGRWPPNALLSHLPGCCCNGVRDVPRSIIEPSHCPGFADVGKPHGSRLAGITTEQVETWSCVEGCPVRALDEQAGERTSGDPGDSVRNGMGYHGNMGAGKPLTGYADAGSASRFFPQLSIGPDDLDAFLYCAKASTAERTADGRVVNRHPTVKPVALMRWLARLVTPPGGIVLDPFTGSGSGGVGALLEGFGFVGCERDADSVATARARCLRAAAEGYQETLPGVAKVSNG